MQEDNSANLFLQHLVTLIRDRMDELSPLSNAPNDFEAGKTLAYHEVADFIVECSRIFSMPLEKIGIENFNPDKLL